MSKRIGRGDNTQEGGFFLYRARVGRGTTVSMVAFELSLLLDTYAVLYCTYVVHVFPCLTCASCCRVLVAAERALCGIGVLL